MAIRNIAHAIKSGETQIGLALGVESMSLQYVWSRFLYILCLVEHLIASKALVRHPLCHLKSTPILKRMIAYRCVWFEGCTPSSVLSFPIQPMGWTSEMVAQTYNISREKQDSYALRSHTRAIEAQKAGIFKDEILPVTLPDSTVVAQDDTIRPGVTAESLAGLKSAFPDWHPASTTAGNASGVGDGAAVCMLMTRERAEKEGLEVLGKYISSVVTGLKFVSRCAVARC
jgi:acetyl-CoA acyltransferase 1